MLKKINCLGDRQTLYDYFCKVSESIPYLFHVDFDTWNISMFHESDDGIPRFSELETYLLYEDSTIKGFIQFGITNYVINDDETERDFSNHYAKIRHIYFAEDSKNPKQLMDTAMDFFTEIGVKEISVDCRYKFSFGMKCYGGYDLLPGSLPYIKNLLKRYSFDGDYESYGKYGDIIVFTKDLDGLEFDLDPEIICEINNAEMWNKRPNHNAIGIDFLHNGIKIGESIINIHYEGVCRLVYLMMNEESRGLGLGSRCMNNVFHILKAKGIRQINTETYTAAGFYAKIGFVQTGIWRSYMWQIVD
jgi:hypothetical protein